MKYNNEWLDNILKSSAKKTCIVTTHRPTVLNMCTSVHKIENSKLVKMEGENKKV